MNETGDERDDAINVQPTPTGMMWIFDSAYTRRGGRKSIADKGCLHRLTAVARHN
jgi:hypothetical protein